MEKNGDRDSHAEEDEQQGQSSNLAPRGRKGGVRCELRIVCPECDMIGGGSILQRLRDGSHMYDNSSIWIDIKVIRCGLESFP